MRDIVFVNGRFVPRVEATVSIEDRGYQFGDGAYEVVRFHGRRGLRLREHLVRLHDSCRHLGIQGGPSVDEWAEIIENLAAECHLPDSSGHVTILYQQITRGASPRNHLFPKVPVVPVCTANFRLAPAYTREQRDRGVALSSQPDERWNRCYIKAISLLPVVLAKQAAAEAGAFEALLVRDDGIVTEGGATNAWCVRGGTVFTHPQGNRILSGIARQMTLEAASRAGVEVREEPVTLQEFRQADEAFITSTTMDVMPVTRLDGEPIGDGAVGRVTRRLMESIGELVAQETGAPAESGAERAAASR